MAQPARPSVPQKQPPEEAEARTTRLAWALGWIVTPLLFFGGIFLGGVYVGANHPEGWIASIVLWFTGLFG